MSTYDANSDYELIDFAGQFDLQNSQLVRAELIAIDRVANTAEVTLLDECAGVEALDLTAVPFFYHCDTSAGTLEDLAKGNQAFADGDIVYILYAPAQGDFVERLYIIGHVDIRGTHNCPVEYLFITLGFNINSTDYSYTTIYDASTGAKLDVDAFVNKDGSSPAKPTSLPATTSSISSWWAYNFGNIPLSPYTLVGTIDVPGYTLHEFDTGDPLQCTTTASSTSYSGDRTAPCSTFNTGNGQSSASTEIQCSYDEADPSPVNVTRESTVTNSGSSVFKVNYTGSTCGAVYAATSYDYAYSYSGVVGYFTIDDGVDTIRVPITWVIDQTTTSDSTCEGSESGLTSTSFSGTDSFTKTVYYDFTLLSRANVESELAWSAQVSGSLPTTPTFDSSNHSLTISTQTVSAENEYPIRTINAIADAEEWFFTPWSNMDTKASTFILGRFFVYTMFGVSSVEEWWQNSTEMTATYNNATTPYPNVITIAQNSGSAKLVLRYKADTCVANITSDIAPPAYNISILDCIRASDISRAAGLNTVIEELVEYIIDDIIDYGNLTTANEDIQDLRNAIVAGPSVQVQLKKS